MEASSSVELQRSIGLEMQRLGVIRREQNEGLIQSIGMAGKRQ